MSKLVAGRVDADALSANSSIADGATSEEGETNGGKFSLDFEEGKGPKARVSEWTEDGETICLCKSLR